MTTPGDESRTELAWREIVQHYGERPVLDEDVRAAPAPAAVPAPIDDDEPEDDDAEDDLPVVDRFRPPPAPPFPAPRTWQRGVAWGGILVAPVLALVIALSSIYVTPLLGWGLVAWFVGGFVYLVREMPRSPRDPWDDGSRV